MRCIVLCCVLFVAGASYLISAKGRGETPEQLFNRLDVNPKDDVVDPNEYFRRFIEDGEPYMQMMFNLYDLNKDGKVTMEEIKGFEEKREEQVAAETRKQRIGWIDKRIQELDANKNMLLEMEELKKYFEEKKKLKTDKLAEIAKPFDLNNDGKFDTNELLEMQYSFE